MTNHNSLFYPLTFLLLLFPLFAIAQRNGIYKEGGFPFIAYKNFWWILDETKGEYVALGIHGQVIYINRSSSLVVAFFSSQPNASAVGTTNLFAKLNACRELSKKFIN